jgi:hypothetical protein
MKKIIYENKSKTYLYFIISLIFIAVGLLSNNSNWLLWSTIFFGLCALIFAIKLFNPNNHFVDPKSDEFKTITNQEFQHKYEDLGIFTYNDDGFIVEIEKKGETKIKWNDIREMIAYKEDHYTTDEICLEIIAKNDLMFKIQEGTPGWFQFLIKTKEIFKTIPKDWEIDIAVPAFEKNLTTIYNSMK